MIVYEEGTCSKCMGTTHITINYRHDTYDEYCPECDAEAAE